MADRKPHALQRAFPGMFYGWAIVAASALLAFVIVGVGFYCLAVLLDGLSRENDWSRTEVAFATSLFFVTTGLCGTVVGRGVDRFGPRVFFVPGALVMGTALLWIGRVDALWQLNLAYLLLAIGFAMAGTVPNNTLITSWFITRRAQAMSISQTGVSIGGIVLVPVATVWIVEYGMDYATGAMALLVVGVTLVTTVLIVRSTPESMGLRPDDGMKAARGVVIDLGAQRRVWSAREAMSTPAFRVVVVAFASILFCQVAIAIHLIAMLRERMDATQAAFAVSATAFGSVVARLVVGRFADRWNKRTLGCVLMVIQAAAIATLAVGEAPWMLFAAATLFGFTIGNLFMLQSLIVGELFGMTSFGTVFGTLQMLTQVISGLGPFVLSLMVDWFGGYRDALLPLAGLAIGAAAVLSRLDKPPAATGQSSTPS